MAVYRARETRRSDAVFHDPFARALAGERGEQIASGPSASARTTTGRSSRARISSIGSSRRRSRRVPIWCSTSRPASTHGPYRMELPASLRWVEVDLPEILDYKAAILGDAKPSVRGGARAARPVEQRRAPRPVLEAGAQRRQRPRHLRGTGDLPDAGGGRRARGGSGRAGAFCALGRRPRLAGPARHVEEADGRRRRRSGRAVPVCATGRSRFFESHGWKAVQVRSILKAASKLERLPLVLRMFAMLPESPGAQGSRPWSAVCLLNRANGPEIG